METGIDGERRQGTSGGFDGSFERLHAVGLV